jgi:hypothetical protein
MVDLRENVQLICIFINIGNYKQIIFLTNGNATIPYDEDEMVDFNEKVTKAFALLCEHLTDAQLAHIQYYENVKIVSKTFCSVHEVKTIGNKLFL